MDFRIVARFVLYYSMLQFAFVATKKGLPKIGVLSILLLLLFHYPQMSFSFIFLKQYRWGS